MHRAAGWQGRNQRGAAGWGDFPGDGTWAGGCSVTVLDGRRGLELPGGVRGGVVGSAGVVLGLGESLLLRLSGSWGLWQLQHLTAPHPAAVHRCTVILGTVFCVLPWGLGRG